MLNLYVQRSGSAAGTEPQKLKAKVFFVPSVSVFMNHFSIYALQMVLKFG